MADRALSILKIAALCSASTLFPFSVAHAQIMQRTQPTQPVLRIPVLQPRTAEPAPETRERTPEYATRATRSDAVVVQNRSAQTIVQSLNVRRQISLNTIRAQPVMTIGMAKLNFQPMLQNPRAPFNVAQSLRAMPQLVDVRADDTSILEVDQGVVVHSVLTYQLKFGVCNDAGRRAQLATSGVGCGQAAVAQVRAAPPPTFEGILRKALPGLRLPTSNAGNAGRIASANPTPAAMRDDIAPDITDLRTALNNPAQRAQIEAEIGAAETTRLANLDDDQMAHDVADYGETTIDQLFYIPRADTLDADAMEKEALSQNASEFLILSPTLTKFGLGKQEQQSPPTQNVTRNLEARIFLTGFTLGRELKWSQEVTKTIKWCLVGCKKTYYVKADAGISYGFGLRFPIKLTGQYNYNQTSGASTASVRTDFTPINGNEADYASAGLAGEKLFEGKELVAQFGAHAGGGYKLPIYGELYLDAKREMDFTEDLDAPFTLGQFTPPAPGVPGPTLEKAFTDFDLIAGRANFVVVAAQVFPAIKVELISDKLRFKLFDLGSGLPTDLTETGQTTFLKVNEKTFASSFSIGEPVYDLSFNVTPGVKARLSVNLGVWGDHWDWDIWFPQLVVKLPPGNAEFACHADTTCTNIYSFSPTSQSVTAGASSAFGAKMQQWGTNFDNYWIPQCADGICGFGIKLVRLNAVLESTSKNEGSKGDKTDAPDIDELQLAAERAKADTVAGKLVTESQERAMHKSASDGWAIIYQSVWSKRCKDVQCIDNIGVIVQQMSAASIAALQANPDEGSLTIQGQIGLQFKPQFIAEIAASKARTAAPPPVILLKPIFKIPVMPSGG
jgi:hypothetical protein